MRIVATSDWHGSIPTEFPEGDVLVIAGDVCPKENHSDKYQRDWIVEVLHPTLCDLDFHDIVLIAGNHDFVFEKARVPQKWFSQHIHYLQDTSVEIDGIKFHGSPYSTLFGNWAFMKEEIYLHEAWDLIPDNTDVLVVHGPPYACTDKTVLYQQNAGSRSLREKIVEVKPTLVVTGHIHEGYGKDMIGRTTVANVSHNAYSPEQQTFYNPINPPMVFDIVK